MHIQAGQIDMSQGLQQGKHCIKICFVDTELLFTVPGGDIGMRFSRHIRIDPNANGHLYSETACNIIDQVQLR